ncbi:MAG: transcriptional repressor NrdR [archaeon]|nr:MAG: transcriptional repressor NrdR [archaeon]
MKCPYCFGKTKVLDKRESRETAIRRRRECIKCKKRFTTYERIETRLTVIKKDGRREPFNRDKIKLGFIKACEKRPISQEKIDRVISEIEAILRSYHKSEISYKLIGNLVMKKLKKLDPIAYIRFASVYRNFKDIDEFKKTIKEVKPKKR